MALLWIDGFDDLATTAGADVKARLGRRYMLSGASNPTFKSLAPRLGNGYALMSDSGTPVMTLTRLTTTADTLIVGVAVFTKVQSTTQRTFLLLYDDATSGVNFRINTELGEIVAYRGSTFLGGSATGLIGYGGWYYIEVKVKCHSTAGTVDIRVGGNTVLSLTGVNTQAGSHTYHNKVWFYLDYYSIDDFYVCDNTGTINNDCLGNVRVVALLPNGDSAAKEWTPSSGTDHYAMVDEGVENDDTDYLASNTTGQTELWDYTDMSGLGTIAGIQVTTVCRDTGTPVGQLKTLVKSDSTTSEDAAQTVGNTDYGVRTRIIETDPNTTAAWTEGGVNGAQFGVKVG